MPLVPFLISASLALAPVASAPREQTVEAPGPAGPLQGTLLEPATRASAVVVIVPGSGATDRDGNSPPVLTAAPYRLLAEGLAARGVATLRVDKRGMFGSRRAVADPNDATIAGYAADARAWAKVARERTGHRCAWILGHSEGGLVALVAAQQPEGICGVVLVSSLGRPLGVVLREQLRSNPANAFLLPQALPAIDRLESGSRVDVTGMNPALLPLFAPGVQPYLIDFMRYRPASVAAAVRVPMLIVQGDRDLQVGLPDARALAAANRRAKLVVVPGANHVLKVVASEDRAANLDAYRDPSRPLAPGVVEAIAAFVGGASRR